MKLKNLLQKIWMLLLIFPAFASFSQVNLGLSPSATVTCSNPNTFYTPDKVNNGIVSQCEFQEFWFTASGTNTTDYIQFTFSSFRDINTIKLFHGYRQTRYVSAATLQIWNGSAWVDHSSYTQTFSGLISQPCEYTFAFPRVNVDRFRLTKFTISGSQTSNPSIREIQVFNLRGNDASITKFFPIFGSGNTPVTAFLRNAGNTLISNVGIGWSVNGVAQTGYTLSSPRPPATFKDSLITLGSYNFVNGNVYTIKAWTSMPNSALDSNMTNDTATYTFTAIGKPATPVVLDQTYCGVSNPLLKGTGEAGTLMTWSRFPGGIPSVGSGDSIVLSTPLNPIDTVKYYARSMRSLNLNHTMAPLTGTWSFGGGTATTSRGTFVNIKPKYNLVMDSILAAITVPAGASLGPYNIRVWYREGRHNGVELDSFKWTALASTFTTIQYTPNYQLPIVPTALSAGAVQLKENTWYSFYYQIDNVVNTVRTNCNGGTYQSIADTVFENEILRVTEGALATGSFGDQGLIVGFIPENHYKCRLSLTSDSAIATIKVHPKPTGAAIVKAKNSLGVFKAGTMSNFDYTAAKEKIEYALAPPTGYTNANHGTNWAIAGLSIATESGTGINALDTTTTLPNATDSAKLSITPQLLEEDSLYKISAILRDLGPYNCDSVIERWLYVAPRPIANFSFKTTNCDGDNITFTNESKIKKGFMQYKWQFINASNVVLDSSDAINPIYKFPTFGFYTVKLRAINAVYGYYHDTTFTITIGEIPDINIKANNACEGVPVTFVNNTTVSTATPSYTWDFGDGASSNLTTPSHLYSAPGGYQVKLTANAAGCISTKTINAYQFARPVAKFDLPSSNLCSNLPIEFKSNSTISIGRTGSYWDFDDMNDISTDDIAYHTFSTGNTFQIKLRSVSEFGCADSITKPLTIKLGPKTSFTVDKTCELENSQFTNNTTDAGSGYGVVWKFSDGGSSTLDNPSKTWTSTGAKTAKLIVTSANGCIDSISQIVNVLPQAIADFESSSSCSGIPVNFVNNSYISKGNLDFVWNFGDGNSSTNGAPSHTYNVTNSSSFNVTLTVNSPGGCPAEITKVINIDPSPICSFTVRDTFIEGQGRGKYFRAANAGYPTYRWKLGDGSSNTNAEFFYKYLYNQEYGVVLYTKNASDCDCTSDTFKFQYNAVSIETLKDIDVAVYPNPTKDIVNIEGLEIIKINLYNATGKLISTVEHIKDLNQIDLSNVASGVYLLEISTLKGTSSTKLIKY